MRTYSWTLKGVIKIYTREAKERALKEFEPQLVKKNQTTLTGDIEEKILSMYAKGMTTSDIETHIQDIYDLECSDSTISRTTESFLYSGNSSQDRLKKYMQLCLYGCYSLLCKKRRSDCKKLST